MSTITTLNTTDSGSVSRVVINTNFSNLNTDKIDTSVIDTDIALTANSDAKIASQKATKTYTDNLVQNLLDYRGAYNASGNTFPTTGGSGSAGAILKGDMWIISVAGVLGGTAVQIGDSIIANVNTPAQTASNWNTLNGNISYVPEDVTNKVISISGSSTDTQYPSAKLLYDQLSGKTGTGTTWNLLGNSGTTPGTNFVGTTDNYDVVFKRYGTESGRLNNDNTSFGVGCFVNNGTSWVNSAYGNYSMYNNTNGTYNTAFGCYSMYNNLGGYSNTAIGANSLYSNTTGSNNTGCGINSLNKITNGGGNIGIGSDAGTYLANGSTPNQTTSNSIYIGSYSKSSADGVGNEIVIGNNTIGKGSNTVNIGDTNITNTYLNGVVTTTGNIELGNVSDTTISRVSAGLIAVEGVNIPTVSNTITLTNKRITPRVLSASSYTTDTGTSLNCDNLDQFIVTAQAGALKLNNPTGTPTDGQKLIVAITGTAARALTYDTQFEASTVALPTTTVTTARLNMGFIWRADTSKWVIVASA